MSREEKRLLAKDEIDHINTSDVEKMIEEVGNEKDFLMRHEINLAKWFLNADGGYSIRKLKKIYKKE
jgi:hypothetical protein